MENDKREIRETTSDGKKIEEPTTPNVVHIFSQRLQKGKKEKSSSSFTNVTPRKESDGSKNEGGSGDLVLAKKPVLSGKDFEKRLEMYGHDFREKQQVTEKDGREQVRTEKKDGKGIKISRGNNDNEMKKVFSELGIEPPSDMPDSLREVVERKGGSNISLVMTTEIAHLDDISQQTHLTIRLLQLKEPNFLTEEEKRILDVENGVVRVSLIQPCHEEIFLGMKKLRGSKCYLLNSDWRSVIENKKNGLEAMDIVQLWSFRYGDDNNLGLVLVKVSSSPPQK